MAVYGTRVGVNWSVVTVGMSLFCSDNEKSVICSDLCRFPDMLMTGSDDCGYRMHSFLSNSLYLFATNSFNYFHLLLNLVCSSWTIYT